MSESTIQPLRWGILATGSIARTFARALPSSQNGMLWAVASRNAESAAAFATAMGARKSYGSYAELLEDPDVDAVYIATPHPMHFEWIVKCAEAGKHILCEKPLTLNSPDASRAVEAARANGVALMEAFMYRCHPQTAQIVELVSSGALGKIKAIEATFSFQAQPNPDSRLFNLDLGGGGILDVGCYVASFTRLVAGAANGKPFAEPLELKALGVLGTTGADLYTVAVARFEGDIVAQLQTGVNLNSGGHCRIIGENATLRVPSPWFCSPAEGRDETVLYLERGGGQIEEIYVPFDRPLYAFEADAMAKMVATGEVPYPAMGPDDALGNMKLLDTWRAAIGLSYPGERGENAATLQVKKNTMRSRELRGIVDEAGKAKSVSQIVMGTMLEGAIEQYSHGLALFDDFFERGGTCFDTAHIYGGGGAGERVMGRWLASRGVRDDVTLIVKGAHPPNCSPDGMRRELEVSLGRLGVERGDIYMLHRDNPQIPIGEWVEALNEGLNKGLYRSFGGSNWSIERLHAGNEYAHAHGLEGFTSASNNFSLARMVKPVWDGCISSSDAESRAWFEKTQTALFSWSSQARGFFARADRNFTSDSELVRSWYSDDNFERLDRAQKLATERGVSSVVVAAAYVLAQPFPIFALIGPRSVSETRDSFEALGLELSPGELRWLNLED
ncbi:scyllo-inositol 2-dehydrogenase (NADP(+)) IolU [Abditibacteriota bacterium]|nr:scyllo-inositol 2-dehydrogenase (NADP(+)) IolU [Abditibacteriota bacterium]